MAKTATVCRFSAGVKWPEQDPLNPLLAADLLRLCSNAECPTALSYLYSGLPSLFRDFFVSQLKNPKRPEVPLVKTLNRFNYYIDTAGKILSEEDLLSNFGSRNSKDVRYSIHLREARGPIVHIRTNKSNNSAGFLNLKTGQTIPAIFNVVGYATFDPISQRAFVSHYDQKTNKMDREGYIDENGVYVILKGNKSEW